MDLDSERPALRPATLRQSLASGSGLWTTLEVVAETASTNADVIAAARAGAAEGVVLVAEHQRAGRGRAGRDWISRPRAGLAVSVLLRPGVATDRWRAAPATRWGWLPLLAGVALAEAVTRQAGVAAVLKWPNDLLVGEGKCAGILAEVAGDAVVIGIGLNVTLRRDEVPAPPAAGFPPAGSAATGSPPAGSPAAALPVTSLALAGAHSTDREALLLALLDRIEQWYGSWRAQSGNAEACGLRAAYLRSCVTVGQPVGALLPGGTRLVGTADTVDTEGRLVLRTAQGTRALAAGDVTHLRLAAPPPVRRPRRRS